MPTIDEDLAIVTRLDGIDTVLRLLADLTKMRIALIARVTADSWTACAVLDEANFGLKVGDKLDVATTY